MALATSGIVLGSYQRWGLGVLAFSPRTSWATMTLRLELGVADSILSMNVSYPTPFCTISSARLTRSATLGDSSKVWGSVLGLSRMEETATYLPPIWLSTSAYSFSAPMARICPLDVVPGSPPHPAATPATTRATARPPTARETRRPNMDWNLSLDSVSVKVTGGALAGSPRRVSPSSQPIESPRRSPRRVTPKAPAAVPRQQHGPVDQPGRRGQGGGEVPLRIGLVTVEDPRKERGRALDALGPGEAPGKGPPVPGRQGRVDEGEGLVLLVGEVGDQLVGQQADEPVEGGILDRGRAVDGLDQRVDGGVLGLHQVEQMQVGRGRHAPAQAGPQLLVLGPVVEPELVLEVGPSLAGGDEGLGALAGGDEQAVQVPPEAVVGGVHPGEIQPGSAGGGSGAGGGGHAREDETAPRSVTAGVRPAGRSAGGGARRWSHRCRRGG